MNVGRARGSLTTEYERVELGMNEINRTNAINAKQVAKNLFLVTSSNFLLFDLIVKCYRSF